MMEKKTTEYRKGIIVQRSAHSLDPLAFVDREEWTSEGLFLCVLTRRSRSSFIVLCIYFSFDAVLFNLPCCCRWCCCWCLLLLLLVVCVCVFAFAFIWGPVVLLVEKFFSHLVVVFLCLSVFFSSAKERASESTVYAQVCITSICSIFIRIKQYTTSNDTRC